MDHLLELSLVFNLVLNHLQELSLVFKQLETSKEKLNGGLKETRELGLILHVVIANLHCDTQLTSLYKSIGRHIKL